MTTTPSPSINVIVPTGLSVGPWNTGWTYGSPDDVWIYIETDGVAGPDLVLDADFTLTGANPQENGGAVALMPGVLPEGGWVAGKHRLILRRWTGRRQSVALPDAEGHKPRATELALDRQMRIAEELSDELELAVVVPPGATPPSPADLAAAAEAGAAALAAAAIAEQAAGQVFGKAEADGSNVGPSFAEAAKIKATGAAAVQRSLASKLDETLSLADHASLNDALAVAGDRGRVIYIPAGGNLHVTEEIASGVYTFIAEGPFTRTGLDVVPGGVLNQLSGTGLLYNAQYLGQWSDQDGTFPFEQAFLNEGLGAPTVFRSLSSAIFAVSSPNGGNAAVFTSRSSDGGTIGSGYALASYVINDRTFATHGSVHGMWAMHSISIRKPGAGTTFGLEPGVANKGSIEVRHPYRAYADGLTCAAWLASGAEMPDSNPITAFLAFVYNGAGAMTGLLVTENALEDRGDGYGELMAVPAKTYISQYLASGTSAMGQTGFQLTMAVATYEKGSRITANDNGVQIASIDDNSNWLFLSRTDAVAGPATHPWFTANNLGLRAWGPANAANNVLMYGESAGSGEAVVLADGSDATVWLVLGGKGGAAVKFVGLKDAANDAAAADAGVPLEGAYRSGGNLKVRIA